MADRLRYGQVSLGWLLIRIARHDIDDLAAYDMGGMTRNVIGRGSTDVLQKITRVLKSGGSLETELVSRYSQGMEPTFR